MYRRAIRGVGTILQFHFVFFIETLKHILFCPYTFALGSKPQVNLEDLISHFFVINYDVRNKP